MFGMSGLLIGPLIASLFLTVWEIYGVAFQDMLPAVGPAKATEAGSELPASEDGVLLHDDLHETRSAGNANEHPGEKPDVSQDQDNLLANAGARKPSQ